MEVINRSIAQNIERETNIQVATAGYPNIQPVMEVGSKFSNYFYAYENENAVGGIIPLYSNLNKDTRFFITNLGIAAQKLTPSATTYVKIHIYNTSGQDFYIGIPFIGTSTSQQIISNISFPFPVEILKDSIIDLVDNNATANSLSIKAYISGIELKR